MNIDHSFFRLIFLRRFNRMFTRPFLLLVLPHTSFLNLCFCRYTLHHYGLLLCKKSKILGGGSIYFDQLFYIFGPWDVLRVLWNRWEVNSVFSSYTNVWKIEKFHQNGWDQKYHHNSDF